MSVFHFKKFDVRNEKSALKVNTDAVLLGTIIPLTGDERSILDIGTGTGVIALIIAQRLSDLQSLKVEKSAESVAGFRVDTAEAASTKDSVTGTPRTGTQNGDAKIRCITGIDIDRDAAKEAEENFANSPWHNILSAKNCSLNDWRDNNPDSKFNIIVSNPPYFDSSLTNPEARKSTARHTGENESGLSYREIMEYAQSALTENGKLALILPADQEAALLRYGRMCGLFPIQTVRIRTVERKKPSRIVVTFSRKTSQPEDITLTMMNQGKYTDQYISLVKDFYLFA